jgi:hypothetical protein
MRTIKKLLKKIWQVVFRRDKENEVLNSAFDRAEQHQKEENK